MRFAEAHQYYQEGHKIRRKEWRKGQYFDDSENYQIRVDCVLANDWEVVNNDTVDNAAQDYGKFLSTNPRYAAAFSHTDDPLRFADDLQKARYASDPKYAAKLRSIITKYDLLQYDQ